MCYPVIISKGDSLCLPMREVLKVSKSKVVLGPDRLKDSINFVNCALMVPFVHFTKPENEDSVYNRNVILLAKCYIHSSILVL